MQPLRAADLPPRSGWFEIGYSRKCLKFQKAILAERSEADAARAWAQAGVGEAQWRRLNTILNNETWSLHQDGWFLPDDELFQILFDRDDLYLFICEVEDQFQRTFTVDEDSRPWPPTLTVGEFYEMIRKSPPGPPSRALHKGRCAVFLAFLFGPALFAVVWSLCKGSTLYAASEFSGIFLSLVCRPRCARFRCIKSCLVFPHPLPGAINKHTSPQRTATTAITIHMPISSAVPHIPL